MRILAVFIFLMSFNGLSVFAQGPRISPEVRQKVLAAKTEALRVMREYSQNRYNNAEYRETARLMAELLEKSGTIPAVGSTLRDSCANPKTVAGTGLISQVISFCPYGLTLNDQDLIQTFIHEAYHLYEGVYYFAKYHPDFFLMLKNNPSMEWPEDILLNSERRAATIELKIMLNIYGCVASETTYFSTLLGLEVNVDYSICNN